MNHDGSKYERMKLIEAQDKSLREHRRQIGAIADNVRALEKVRDVVNAAVAKKFDIRMQDMGIDINNDDAVEIGQKIVKLDSPEQPASPVDEKSQITSEEMGFEPKIESLDDPNSVTKDLRKSVDSIT